MSITVVGGITHFYSHLFQARAVLTSQGRQEGDTSTFWECITPTHTPSSGLGRAHVLNRIIALPNAPTGPYHFLLDMCPHEIIGYR